MSTPAQVAAGIASVIDNVTSLRVFDHVPDDVNPPVVVLSLGELLPVTMGRGVVTMPFEAAVLVPRSSDRAGQSKLYAYAAFTGSESIWAAFSDNNSLGLNDGTKATIKSYRPLRVEEYAGYNYYGGVFEIQVTTPGV